MHQRLQGALFILLHYINLTNQGSTVVLSRGWWLMEPQLVEVQRIRHCRVFCPKWDIRVTPLPPKPPWSLKKRDGKIVRPRGSGCLPHDCAVTPHTRTVQGQVIQHPSTGVEAGHEVLPRAHHWRLTATRRRYLSMGPRQTNHIPVDGPTPFVSICVAQIGSSVFDLFICFLRHRLGG